MLLPPKKFRDYILESLLELLWRQWSALGVSGYGETQNSAVIDPEALLIFSCSICRYDQRLFDAMLDWLDKNERFINIQRLRAMVSKEKFAASDILSAVAACMAEKNPTMKWRRLADAFNRTAEKNASSLFFLKNGDPMPTPTPGKEDPVFRQYGYLRNTVENRNRALCFPPHSPETLLLQIRALFGIGARSEALLYLVLNEKGTIQNIASDTYYSWRSIQDALFEMGHSGLLYFPESKRGRFYRLDGKPWLDILLRGHKKKIRWICWPPLFRAFELIWEKFNNPDFMALSPLAQTAELRELMRTGVAERLEHAGFGSLITNHGVGVEEEYLESFQENIDKLLHEVS